MYNSNKLATMSQIETAIAIVDIQKTIWIALKISLKRA